MAEYRPGPVVYGVVRVPEIVSEPKHTFSHSHTDLHHSVKYARYTQSGLSQRTRFHQLSIRRPEVTEENSHSVSAKKSAFFSDVFFSHLPHVSDRTETITL